jgi:hypothetical protein
MLWGSAIITGSEPIRFKERVMEAAMDRLLPVPHGLERAVDPGVAGRGRAAEARPVRLATSGCCSSPPGRSCGSS